HHGAESITFRPKADTPGALWFDSGPEIRRIRRNALHDPTGVLNEGRMCRPVGEVHVMGGQLSLVAPSVSGYPRPSEVGGAHVGRATKSAQQSQARPFECLPVEHPTVHR